MKIDTFFIKLKLKKKKNLNRGFEDNRNVKTYFIFCFNNLDNQLPEMLNYPNIFQPPSKGVQIIEEVLYYAYLILCCYHISIDSFYSFSSVKRKVSQKK